MSRLWVVCVLLCLIGCKTIPPAAVQPDWQAEADAQDRLRRQQVEAELAALREVPRPAPAYPEVPTVPFDEPPPKNPLTIIKQANTNALVHPRPEWFVRSTVLLPYREGGVYYLVASTNQPMTFYFPPDELLISHMGLEGQKRWTVKEMDLDDGGGKRSTLTLIPNEESLTAGMTIITSKRIYNVSLKSQAAPGVIGVRWRYPDETVAQAAKTMATAPTSEIWHLGYTITVAQGSPAWTPVRAYDTGLKGKTIVEFGPGLAVTSLPEVYAPNAAGELEQVNGRLLGQRYVIDLVAPRFELRLGVGDAAEVVSIQRDTSYRSVLCHGDDACLGKGA